MFLQLENGELILNDTIDLNYQTIIIPHDKSSYLGIEYVFSSKEEIELYRGSKK
jgi:hypothetical protein